ncbi:ribbon-helix-helix protein, CopG family [Crystallibacter degradans]|uniref:ribbon-helix-helix protein, CopG family n=1 Tax=Crystallibacter degradans TaxID=2726743 RepID=UPI001475A0AF|nr:ribbon-helix-helix protein, CopG family [Arthrobacter sp. SF27]NMR28193.1 ribbon-helix-helix protein, CopG family [Arthrobacter sp. SF27]
MSTKKAMESNEAELSPQEQEHYEELAAWAETADIAPNARITKAEGPEAGRSLLEAALGSPEAVRRAVGKPSLSKEGISPTRSIRLPKELDAQLVARSESEHRKPSEIVRDALREYLGRAS